MLERRREYAVNSWSRSSSSELRCFSDSSLKYSRSPLSNAASH